MISPALLDAVDAAGPRIARLAAKHDPRYREEVEHEIRQRLLMHLSGLPIHSPAALVAASLERIAGWEAARLVKKFERFSRGDEDRSRRVPLSLDALERAPGVPLELESPSDSGPFDVEAEDFWRSLRRHLPAQMWQAVYLRFTQNLTGKQIGRRLGLSESRAYALVEQGVSCLQRAKEEILESVGMDCAPWETRSRRTDRRNRCNLGPDAAREIERRFSSRVCSRLSERKVEAAVRRCRCNILKRVNRWPPGYREEIRHETEQYLRTVFFTRKNKDSRMPLENFFAAIVPLTVTQQGARVLRAHRGQIGKSGRVRDAALSLQSCDSDDEERRPYDDLGVVYRSVQRRVEAEDAINHFWRRAWQVLREAAPDGYQARKNPRAVGLFWSLYGPLHCRMSWKTTSDALGVAEAHLSYLRQQAVAILKDAGLAEILE